MSDSKPVGDNAENIPHQSPALVPPTEFEAPSSVSNFSFPLNEEAILAYWEQINAFKTQQELTAGFEPFKFFDGPPFATGLPHYGHLLAGTIKDVVCRYWSQNGRYVERRFGWDTHGLPVEYEIDKKLGIKSPSDVEKIGIATYNKECRNIVMRYSSEWRKIVERAGRWIDFDHDYKTLNPTFMESVWWVFSQLWEKNLIYKGVRVMPYSTACATTLSNFEANLNYKDVHDMTAIVSFPILGRKNSTTGEFEQTPECDASFVAWTTTPWTLPSNLALCVNATMDYVKIFDTKSAKRYILAECRLCELYPPLKPAKGSKKVEAEERYTIEAHYKGSDLVGLHYKPLFDDFKEYSNKYDCWVVVADDYVSGDAGVGVVHIAPFFGEDDFRVGLANNIFERDGPIVCPVDNSGCFTDEVKLVKGLYIKDADKVILADLKARNLLVKQESHVHSYPFCWRSETPLIYKAVPSWFVRVEQIKDRLVENNKKASWVPKAIQEKRFHNWLMNARDWNISRSRYWGTPIPVWVSEDGKVQKCISSIAELAEATGRPKESIVDLHRDSIDSFTIPDPRGPEYPSMHRINDVFDCWFESGSMPYAQQHYPFENNEKFEENFPADFIAEGLDQTRGWFYTLLILSTALFDSPPAMNVIVNGLVLAKDGQKMSKRLRNYPPVVSILDSIGADAMRLYLCNSPAVRAMELRFNDSDVKNIHRDVFIPWLSAYKFFAQSVLRFRHLHGVDFLSYPQETVLENLKNDVTDVLDRWIIASFEKLVILVKNEMEHYNLFNVLPALLSFINDLTNWYIKLNRSRIKGKGSVSGDDDDNDDNETETNGNDQKKEQEIVLNVLFYVLFGLAKLMAPFTPFLADWFYLQLRPLLRSVDPEVNYLTQKKFKSVHFLPFPKVAEGGNLTKEFYDTIPAVKAMKDVIVLCRMIRKDKCGISSLKQPLRALTVYHDNLAKLEAIRNLQSYIKSELTVLNVYEGVLTEDVAQLQVVPDFAAIREIYPREQVSSVVKTVRAFCNPENFATNKELIDTLREKDSVIYSGIEITKQICQVRLELIPVENKQGASDDNGFLCVFDTLIDDELRNLKAERELFSTIQKARKSCSLNVGDVADVYITFAEETETKKNFVETFKGSYASKVNGKINAGAFDGEPKGSMSASDEILGDFTVSLQ